MNIDPTDGRDLDADVSADETRLTELTLEYDRIEGTFRKAGLQHERGAHEVLSERHTEIRALYERIQSTLYPGLPMPGYYHVWPNDFTARVDDYAAEHGISHAAVFRRIAANTGNAPGGLRMRYDKGRRENEAQARLEDAEARARAAEARLAELEGQQTP
jgi:hypothetical protein